MSRLQVQHNSLDFIIKDLSDSDLRKAIEPGKWSIFENIAHLAAYQHSFQKRIGIILNEENPSFPRYTAEADPLFHDMVTFSTNDVIDDLNYSRNEINVLLSELNDTELIRTAVHPLYGKMDIMQWTEFFLLHEAHHLFTIFKLERVLRKG